MEAFAGVLHGDGLRSAGVLRIGALAGETTASLIARVAAGYGLESRALLSVWRWSTTGRGMTAGRCGRMLLDAPGRRVLAGMCGVAPQVLARALPSWGREDPKLATGGGGEPRAVWRVGGAVVGPVAFGCRLCAARRTGAPVTVVGYVPRWGRVCVRHGRWGLDADADQRLEYLDVRGVPEVVAAQRRWASVARRAVRAGTGPERVFALAQAVVARWLSRPCSGSGRRSGRGACTRSRAGMQVVIRIGRRLWGERGRLPGGGGGGQALLDPAMAELVWADSGAGRPRALPADGLFCRRLGERLGRTWLGPLAATDHGGPLIAWMGSVIRLRRGAGGPPGYDNDPWWLRQEHRVVAMAGQLRVLGKEKKAPGSGTMSAAVPAEQRMLITSAIDSAEEQLLQLREQLVRPPRSPGGCCAGSVTVPA
ncbi:hypothetical protein SRIMM317S_06932 [Streptomyces rimosus subsp. rimosus]